MIYLVRMIVQGIDTVQGTATRIVETKIAGCRDADDARKKARDLYTVIAFKAVTPAAE